MQIMIQLYDDQEICHAMPCHASHAIMRPTCHDIIERPSEAMLLSDATEMEDCVSIGEAV
jgi:hypothetical protein